MAFERLSWSSAATIMRISVATCSAMMSSRSPPASRSRATTGPMTSAMRRCVCALARMVDQPLVGGDPRAAHLFELVVEGHRDQQ
jgi:hypothetical protein